MFGLGLIFGAIKAFIPTVAKVATLLVESPVLNTVKMVIQAVATLTNVLKPNENIEELGQKAMQEDTRPMMEDETAEQYIEYLRNEIKLDEEKMKTLSPDEKLKADALGTALATTAISEKCGVEISPDFVRSIHTLSLTAKQITEYIESFSNNGIDSLDALTDYLRGDLSGDQKDEIHQIVKETEGKLHPELSNGEILCEIDAMKEKMEEKQ